MTPAFTLEAQLCALLAGRLHALFGTRRVVRVLDQLQVGGVIPDLVAVRVLPRIPSMLDLRLSGFDAFVISQLLGGPSRVDTIVRRLYTETAKVVASLKRLERQRIVQKVEARRYAVDGHGFPICAEVIAIEAKLRRWREAVVQAGSYRMFANEAYVALPHSTILAAKVDVERECIGQRVGLMAVSPGHVELVVPAPRHAPMTGDWVWVIGRALARNSVGPTATPGRPGKRSATRFGGLEPCED